MFRCAARSWNFRKSNAPRSTLVVIEGLTFAEAASALDVPVGTLMSRLARARATLRAIEDKTMELPLKPDKRQHLKIVGGSDGPSR
ncbi:MAG: sigma factor-like helix-turn-helix DNA-binding protein [Allosphingosinicella sp.]